MSKLPIRSAAPKRQTSQKPRQRVSRTPKILAVFERLQGQPVSLNTLMQETGFEANVIQSAIADMRNRNKLPIATLVRGNVWQYGESKLEEETPASSSPKKSKLKVRTFTEVGTTSDGTIIARHEDKLYRIEEM